MRRPVFWFLWPQGDPGPLDAAAVQSRWVRVCPRGPWRWAFLIAFSLLVVTVASSATAAALSRAGWVPVAVGIVIVVPLIALLARAWVAGTYVSDRGIKVSCVLATDVLPWSTVTDISHGNRSRLLGTPLTMAGARVEVSGPDGVVATHVETASPDLWLRPQAWEAAADRLRTWWRETR